MEVFVFRTDIRSRKKVKYLESILNKNNGILNWSVDNEDIDNVLRIEAAPHLRETDVIVMAKMHGINVEPLID
jgi:hypothetical protein